jgi:hypothetical protein
MWDDLPNYSYHSIYICVWLEPFLAFQTIHYFLNYLKLNFYCNWIVVVLCDVKTFINLIYIVVILWFCYLLLRNMILLLPRPIIFLTNVDVSRHVLVVWTKSNMDRRKYLKSHIQFIQPSPRVVSMWGGSGGTIEVAAAPPHPTFPRRRRPKPPDKGRWWPAAAGPVPIALRRLARCVWREILLVPTPTALCGDGGGSASCGWAAGGGGSWSSPTPAGVWCAASTACWWPTSIGDRNSLRGK